MAARQLFGSAPRAWRRARQAAAHDTATGEWRQLGREVRDDPGDGPNGPVWSNGPAQQLGWRRVSGQNQESE
jgi:hypothetical protein